MQTAPRANPVSSHNRIAALRTSWHHRPPISRISHFQKPQRKSVHLSRGDEGVSSSTPETGVNTDRLRQCPPKVGPNGSPKVGPNGSPEVGSNGSPEVGLGTRDLRLRRGGMWDRVRKSGRFGEHCVAAGGRRDRDGEHGDFELHAGHLSSTSWLPGCPGQRFAMTLGRIDRGAQRVLMVGSIGG